MATAKRDRNFVAKHMRTVNRAAIHMDKRRKERSRKNKNWKMAD